MPRTPASPTHGRFRHPQAGFPKINNFIFMAGMSSLVFYAGP
jgi:hypothetical protein